MNDNCPIPEAKKGTPAYWKECLDSMARLQKDAAAECAMNDTPIEDLEISIRVYSVLKKRA